MKEKNQIIKRYLNNVITPDNKDLELLFDEAGYKNSTESVIFVATGTNGIIAGALETIEAINEYLKSNNKKAEVLLTGSNGLCAYAPMIDIKIPGRARVCFKNITSKNVDVVLNEIFHNIITKEYVIGQYESSQTELWDGIPLISDHPFFKQQKRILLDNCGIIDPQNIVAYISNFGYKAFTSVLRNKLPIEVIELIIESKLRGRGGGGYITGNKWKIAHETSSNQKYLICNADESDPGAYMDRILIEGDPHKIIEGTAIAAYAIGASKAFIYIRSDYKLAIERLQKAIDDAYDLNLLGFDIFESGFNLDIVIRKGAGAYVCGEETALISSIEGRRGMPSLKPPYPAEKGLFGKPTVVNNVETIANVPAIINNGTDWFNTIGTKRSKGTKLFSISGKIDFPGLIEVPMGISIESIIKEIVNRPGKDLHYKALQIGGPSGYCIPESEFKLPIDFEILKEKGLGIGSGGMLVLEESSCIVDISKYFMDYFQKESCGKCIPCREGTQQLYEILENITKRPNKETGNETLERFKGVMQIESLAEVIKDTSLCGLGQNAPNIVLSTLKYFREEYEEHIFDRKCRAKVCRDLGLYYINVDLCTGCAACAKKCPTNAIVGTVRHPYFIVEEKCIGCGACKEVCKFGAVFLK
jgi:NADP-reducing hydrogenase subunit HndC